MMLAAAHAVRHARVTGWGWFWLAWIMTGAAVEIYWVSVASANTLSDQIWGAEGLDFAHPLDFASWLPLHWGIAITLWLLFGWLSVHFAFGWLR